MVNHPSSIKKGGVVRGLIGRFQFSESLNQVEFYLPVSPPNYRLGVEQFLRRDPVKGRDRRRSDDVVLQRI